MALPPHPIPVPAPARPLPVDDVLRYARTRVAAAAAGQWPGAGVVLGEHVPSITSYVCKLAVDRRPYVAKFEFLGVSLASVLRGTHGTWGDVQEAQAVYEAGEGNLLERQAVHYGLLHSAGLGAPRPALRNAVLFTEAAAGRTLADLVAQRPTQTGDLLTQVVRALDALAQPATARIVRETATPGCTIPGTFARKFTGLPKPDGVLGTVVERLLPLAAALPDPGGEGRGVVFGDLKPEHILVTGGAGRPVFLDPGLTCGPVILDAAKLVSRLLLHLCGSRPRSAKRIVSGVGDFAFALARATPDPSRWLWQLVLLWAMDTASVLHTVSTAPALLPLPVHLDRVDLAESLVTGLLDRNSRTLEAVTDGQRLWPLVLDNTATAVSRCRW
ncbi:MULTISPECIES: hypothetical protein [Streptomyces]|uniref:hypothetical protein n=1 Tax=Streptomyces TaxID=1883 RepID=UPI001E530DB4|nr:hypothetical protein [Streptomyces tsukubensis]